MELFGDIGTAVMAGKSQYSDETRAAVMAALLAGQSAGEVAKEYNLPESTVRYWKGQTTDATRQGPIAELLMGYLEEGLVTLRAQAKFFRNEKWLAKQDASELGVLHGILTDKAIRLLEAFGAGDTEAED